MPITPLGAFNVTVTDRHGNTVPGATVEIRDETGLALSTIYSDRLAATPVTNPATADANGFVRVYAAPGYYQVKTIALGVETTWRDVEIGGTSAALDAATNLVRPWAATRVLEGDEGFGIDFTKRSFAVMDHASTKIAAGKPEDFLTISRASAGTYVDKNGIIQSAAANTIRYTHDPVTGQPLGIISEAARTNLCRDSGNIAGTGWGGAGYSVTTPGVVKPNGGANAQLATEDTSTGLHYVNHVDSTGDCTQVFTASVWLKASGRSRVWFFMYENGASTNRIEFYADLTGLGSIDTTNSVGNGSYVSSKIKRYVNGWYRLQITGRANTVSGTGVAFQIRFIQGTSGAVTNYTGDGVSGVYIWGGQIEQGYGATTLIETSGASAARAGDNYSLDVSLFPLSRESFTMLFKFRSHATDPTITTVPFIMRESAVNNNSASFRWGVSLNLSFQIFSGASNEAAIATGVVVEDTDITIMGSMRKNLVDARSTLSTGTQDTVAAIPTATFTSCQFGQHNGNNPMNGTIAKVAFKTRTTPTTEMGTTIAAI